MDAVTKDRPVIDRFCLDGDQGYSEYWRRNKSPVEILELARLLLGLRKVAEHVGRNVGTIVWSGMAVPDGVAIDPTPVLGRYPVPADKVDLMVGLTIRKAYEKTEWSRRFKDLALSQLKLERRPEYVFTQFFTMAERVYFDCLSNKSVLGSYTETARHKEIERAFDHASHPPTLSELLHIWWDIAADRSGKKYKEPYVDTSARRISARTSLEKFYRAPIGILNSIVQDLMYECPKIQGVTERGHFRLKLYLDVWARLYDLVKTWAVDSKDPFLLERKYDQNILTMNQGDEEEKPPVVLNPDLLAQALPSRTIDFTDQIKDFVVKFDDVVKIEGTDIVMPVRNRVNRKLLHHLQFVMKSAAQRSIAHNRGLAFGKIDRRRLHRALTTGQVFEMKKDRFELENDIVLLVDATGSMAAPNRWEKAQEIHQTLFSAVATYSRNARLFAYNEERNTCRLTEIYLKGTFYTVLPHGKTASGEAIMATALVLKKKHKRPLIIHLTDGASNWGCGVAEAIAMCRKNGIGLLTLGLGCGGDGKKSLVKEYGRLVQFVDHIDHLPRMFRNLLQYGKWDLGG